MNEDEHCKRCGWDACRCLEAGGSTCNVAGCEKSRAGKYKMCGMHRTRWKNYGDVMRVRPPAAHRASERFWAKVDIANSDGCWLYGGYRNRAGYGEFTVSGKPWMAHRFAYAQLVEPVPDDLTLDHLCLVKNCVNPNHLEPVTNAENIRRRWSRQRKESA